MAPLKQLELEEERPVKPGSSRRVRMMEPRDLPALWRSAAAQNRRDGTSYPVPLVFEMDEANANFGKLMPNVALALVTEVLSPKGWRVRMGHVFLRTVEAMSFGGGKEDMDFSALHIPMALDVLRRQHYDDVHTLVPQARATAEHSELLESYGFNRIDHRLAHFFRML